MNNFVCRTVGMVILVILVGLCSLAVGQDDQQSVQFGRDSLPTLPPAVVPRAVYGDIDTMPLIIRSDAFKPESGKAVPKMDVPLAFDLRDYGGESLVGPVKTQSGGTCWAFGAMASIESNLMMSGLWVQSRTYQWYALIDEYHMDYWAGFNDFFNGDVIPAEEASGAMLHFGGDYMMAAAYLGRTDGAVDWFSIADNRGYIYDLYSTPSPFWHAGYIYYFPREVVWLTAGWDLSNLSEIKAAVMQYGAVGTALAWDVAWFRESDNTFYQQPVSEQLPNHAVAIIGWDDTISTTAPERGAWLVRDSYGPYWADDGHFWVSYFDKWVGQHPEMGAVSFRDVIRPNFHNIYQYDYHGWRATKTETSEAFNAYVAEERSCLTDVNLYTARDDALYEIDIFDTFENGQLSGLLSSALGVAENVGYHTIQLPRSVILLPGNDFFIRVRLSEGGQPYDCNSVVPLLIGDTEDPSESDTVYSHSEPGQSYYLDGSTWEDLYYFDTSANFCIKGFTQDIEPIETSVQLGAVPLEVTFVSHFDGIEYASQIWDLGDGTTSYDLVPVHTYTEPGIYDVSIDITTPTDAQYGCISQGHVLAHADTVDFADPIFHPNGVVQIDVMARNELVLDQVCIPILWDDGYPIVFDSVSLVGTRVEVAGTADIKSFVDVWNAAAIYILTPWDQTIDPGVGPIISLYFNIGESSWPEQNPIHFWNYYHYELEFSTYAGGYPPAVGFNPPCCQGRTGDTNLSGVDEPTIGDVSLLIEALFIARDPALLPCLTEADVNQSGGIDPTFDDISIADASVLIDYLFITGPGASTLPACLE